MKGRWAAVASVATILALAIPGVAAGQSAPQQVTSPAANAAVTGPAAVTVQVNTQSGGLFPDAHVVRARLGTPSGQPLAGSREVDLQCQSGPCDGASTWGGVSLTPGTLAPFGGDVAGCNGGFTILASVDGGAYAGHAFRVSVAPSAPSGVQVAPDELAATVRWTKASQRDVSGYRVQRRAAGGSFATVGEVGPGATTFTDGDAPEGEVEYRVLTLRPDGLVNGSPAAPCADTGKDLVAASTPVATTISAPAPEPTESESPSGPSRPSRPAPGDPSEPTDGGGDGEPGDGGSEGEPTDGGSEGTPTDGGSEPGDGGAEPGDDGSEAPEDDGAEAVAGGGTAGPTRGRVSPPSAIGTLDAPEADVAGAESPTVSQPRDVFYGEGLAFDEELDFGDQEVVGSVEPRSSTVVETQTVRIPGALQAVFGEELELDRLLGPIATGLLLLTISVHLRRWSHAVS